MLTVYSKENCSFCVQAKKLLDRYAIKYQEIRIDQNEDARNFILSEGHRTVPQIYKNNQLFVEGGYQGLSRLTESQIKEKLNAG